MKTDHANAKWGFSIALLTPALVSTFKQAEREAAPELHALADFFIAQEQSGRLLTHGETAALCRLGVIFVQQLSNGACFLSAAQLAVQLAGVPGGVIAQMAITLNTMFHPSGAQRFNPSQLMARLTGSEPNWVAILSPSRQLALARFLGKWAAKLGYGRTSLYTRSNIPAGAAAAG